MGSNGCEEICSLFAALLIQIKCCGGNLVHNICTGVCGEDKLTGKLFVFNTKTVSGLTELQQYSRNGLIIQQSCSDKSYTVSAAVQILFTLKCRQHWQCYSHSNLTTSKQKLHCQLCMSIRQSSELFIL